MTRLKELTKLLKDYETLNAEWHLHCTVMNDRKSDDAEICRKDLIKTYNALHDFIFTGSITSEYLDKFVSDVKIKARYTRIPIIKEIMRDET